MPSSYQHKPTSAQGESFDGSLAQAQAVQAWVQQESGLLAVLAPDPSGGYRLSIPTPAGYQGLEAGMTLLEVGTDFWPITPDALTANYDEQGEGDASQ